MDSSEYEVKAEIIRMAKRSMKPAAILNHLKRDFPFVPVRKLVEWIDDLIEVNK